jgi:hypothetical protein
VLKPRPWLVAVPASIVLFGAGFMLLRGVWPFTYYFYMSAWYPTILILDAVQATRSGKYYLLTRPAFALSLLFWSAVLWFFFELVNFRLANWYYVNLPPQRAARWIGTTVSFATVLPAIFLAERVLAGRGLYDKLRWPTFDVSRSGLVVLFAGGIAFGVLSMLWPRAFFPMVWGALTLLLEAWNYSRDPERSLLGDLSRGRPARMLRLLSGGLAIGFLWEFFFNDTATTEIYTVPGFETRLLRRLPDPGTAARGRARGRGRDEVRGAADPKRGRGHRRRRSFGGYPVRYGSLEHRLAAARRRRFVDGGTGRGRAPGEDAVCGPLPAGRGEP